MGRALICTSRLQGETVWNFELQECAMAVSFCRFSVLFISFSGPSFLLCGAIFQTGG